MRTKQVRTEYLLKRPLPHTKYKSFSILEKLVFPDTRQKPSYKKVTSVEITKLNEMFHNKVYDYSYTEKCFLELKEKLYLEKRGIPRKLTHSTENLNLLQKYFDDVYSSKDIIDKDAEYNALRRSIEALGNINLISSDKKTIQEAIERNTQGDNKKYNRRIQKLSQLIKYFNLPIKLQRKREGYEEPKFLTLEEFKKAVSFIEDNTFKTICWIAFTTGMRAGEIFAFPPNRFNKKQGSILVLQQMDTDLLIRDTKNKKSRTLSVFKEGDEHLEKWIETPLKLKQAFRKTYSTKFAKMLKHACYKAFPGNEDKIIKFHDLRHSYAKRLFDAEVKLEFVADCLGDDIRVAKKYYIGWMLSEDALAALSKVTR